FDDEAILLQAVSDLRDTRVFLRGHDAAFVAGLLQLKGAFKGLDLDHVAAAGSAVLDQQVRLADLNVDGELTQLGLVLRGVPRALQQLDVLVGRLSLNTWDQSPEEADTRESI